VSGEPSAAENAIGDFAPNTIAMELFWKDDVSG
jgi:hypothetical protein